MSGESSPINTETLVEYRVSGDVLGIDFVRRVLTISMPDNGLGYELYRFRPEQEEYIRRHLRLSQPVELTVWKYVTGDLDDGLWMRDFSQSSSAVLAADL